MLDVLLIQQMRSFFRINISKVRENEDRDDNMELFLFLTHNQLIALTAFIAAI